MAQRKSDIFSLENNCQVEKNDFVRAEKALDKRIEHVLRAVKRADLLTASTAFTTIALALVFLGVLHDSWLSREGLNQNERIFYAFFIGIASLGVFIWKIIPVFRQRINDLYAAKILEDSHQVSHNLVINWFLLRKDNLTSETRNRRDSSTSPSPGDNVRKAILQNLVLQAERKTHEETSETAVDYTPLIRWGVLLAILVFCLACYSILSPKKPFASIGRIVAPLSDLSRPQAWKIESVEPGDVELYQGDFVEFQAIIPDVKDSETVELLWSTPDGRTSDLSLPLDARGRGRFGATFPEKQDGLTEDIVYRIVVDRGSSLESSSDIYHIKVLPQPSFRIASTTLNFPSYTGLPSQTFANQGEIRALENTTVEVCAESNEKLERAYLFPDGDPTRAIKMVVDPQNSMAASTTFTLAWKPNADEKRPEFSSYTLSFESVDGKKNRDIISYPVSIIPDLPPVVEWKNPRDEKTEVPFDGEIVLEFLGQDQDYALRNAKLNFSFSILNQGDEKDFKPAPNPVSLEFTPLEGLASPSHDPALHIGAQKLSYSFSPRKLGLEVGDEIEIWATVTDSKLPEPNVVSSEKRVFSIIPKTGSTSSEQSDSNDEGAGQSAGGDNSAGNQNSSNTDNSQNGNSTKSGQSDGTGESGDKSETPNADGESGEGEQGDSSESGAESQTSSANQGANASESGTSSQAPETDGSQGATQSGSNGDSESGGGNSQDQSDPSESYSQGASDGSNSPNQSSSNSSVPSPSSDSAADDKSRASEQTPTSKTQPQDAFQKILDYMNQQSGNSESAEDTSTEQNGNQGKASSSEAEGENGNTSDGENANKESSAQAGNGTKPSPNEDNSLQNNARTPTQPTPQKPGKDAHTFNGNTPENIDENINREKGEVDPNTNNYLAQNASENQPTSSKRKNNNANVSLDSLDQNPAVAADDVDPHAQEAKGTPNFDLNQGKTEVDEDAPQNSGRSTVQGDKPQDAEPANIGGRGSSANEKNQRSASSDASSENGSGKNNSEQNSNKKNSATSASNGNEDGISSYHGGGGAGQGLGELLQKQASLAPADAPTLQYAEEAANLVLEYLSENQRSPDPRLLNELGWTEEELRAFYQKWNAMRTAALKNAPNAKNRYLEELEKQEVDASSLPDSPEKIETVIGKPSDDRKPNDGYREATRVKTPERLSERVRAFTRGVGAKKNLP
ncbi:MAG: hypothetical protein ACI4NP_06185 [Thermoguttaceae bacterium]